ncbi:nicotinate phosphoribosyltransferase [Desulfurispirillum indicum]|uniref:nicotinate phosphoribosyltransferase n=1 Tax=Desulfurispirillum indicum TaxID=936456 RepID=UPI001CF93693|nr:nicotinate phosphoribosyltransferase [Desulfurispirillum indicum]UCZ56444.1 nicotinate phosphoribosyltransferase [Desulfurispirillum indicum]
MIIQSLLDTDLYKFTMMQVAFHQYPKAHAEYRFFCRTSDADLGGIVEAVRTEVRHLCTLQLTAPELDFLASLPYMQPDFLAFLERFRPDERNVSVKACGDANLEIIIRGGILQTILFEIPLLAIVNELYYQQVFPDPDFRQAWQRLWDKVELVRQHPDGADFHFVEFGTRRRFSRRHHFRVMEYLRKELPANCVGTSNLHLARTMGLQPVGTMAHEYLQICQVLAPQLQKSQRYAFELWRREYGDQLGIALSDIITLEAFLRDFDAGLASAYAGARQDSGDPFHWGDSLIAHYQKLGIDPTTKTLVFSDGLNIPKALEIHRYFRRRIRTLFGIGTNLTNDLGGYTPLDIVIKMTRCNGQPVAKISDSPGKSICTDPTYIDTLKEAFDVQNHRAGDQNP